MCRMVFYFVLFYHIVFYFVIYYVKKVYMLQNPVHPYFGFYKLKIVYLLGL